MKNELFRQIPAVNDLLENEKGKNLIQKYNHNLVLKAVREVLDDKRNTIAKNSEQELKEFLYQAYQEVPWLTEMEHKVLLGVG